MPQATIEVFWGASRSSPAQSSNHNNDDKDDIVGLDSPITQVVAESPQSITTSSQSEVKTQIRTRTDTRLERRDIKNTELTDFDKSASYSSSMPGHRKFCPCSRGPGPSLSGWKSQPPTANQHAAPMSFRASKNLAFVAKETLDVLPGLLHDLPHVSAHKAYLCRLPSLKPLDPAQSPRYVPPGGAAPRTLVRVINADTLDAALEMPGRLAQEDLEALRDAEAETELKSTAKPADAYTSAASAASQDGDAVMVPDYGRVAVLNFASNYLPGGGWLKGARAQEEALCYRSSLFLSLDKQFYPLRQLNGIYSPDVLVIRSSMDEGHELLHPKIVPDANNLPVVSAISIAAIRCPALKKVHYGSGSAKEFFETDADRELTKAKMRLCLRIAGINDHALVVLGALGCGAFRNPPEEVAKCWLEVIREHEFTGGRFRELCFAIWDRQSAGNFEIFRNTLDGLQI